MAIESFSGDYRFLSNFWFAKVEWNDIMFPTVEHAYVAAKTLDVGLQREIANIAKPGDVKRIGRQLILRSDWEKVKYNTMGWLVEQKFNINSDLATKLLATGDEQLIEGNHWNDTYWGVCRGKGLNKLGEILMIVRNDLRMNQS